MVDTSNISAGQRVVGTISAAEDLVVVGRVEGRIQSEAVVTVEAQAIVEADIHARHVIVKGVVIGEILGVEGIEITPSGQVLGDLKTRRLALRSGGRVAGQVISGVEVQPFVYGGVKGGNAGRARPAVSPAPSRAGWPTTDEVVETSPARPASTPQAEMRKAKKEPSREVI